MVALDAVKFHVLQDPSSLSNSKWKTQLFETALNLIQEDQLKANIKVKAAELLASLVYLGHLKGLEAASKDRLSQIVLDQINNHSDLTRTDSENWSVDIADALKSNVQFEKLINFSAEFNLESGGEDENDFARPYRSRRVY